MPWTDLWKFLAGTGLFIYGMNLMESRLKKSSGRSLKLFLRRNTGNLFKSISGGAIVTALIQSSSVVSLIVLAFVESGIITFRNALGVIFGTNLGTTISGWLFVSLGFKLDILSFTFPVIAVSAFMLLIYEKRNTLNIIFTVFLSLGILFLGISFMKDAALELVKDFDPSNYSDYGTFTFVIIGFILTSLIQSSTAAMALSLTALHAGMLTFPAAAALVIGSEVGTTIKILFWGMKGSADKKRVAYGNFFYNIGTSLLAYATLPWLIWIISEPMGIRDHLTGLVTFQSLINFVSILVFVPVLNPFAAALEKRFRNDSDNDILRQPPIPMLAAETLRKEGLKMLDLVQKYNSLVLNYSPVKKTNVDLDNFYLGIKANEGHMLNYYASSQAMITDAEDAAHMTRIVNALRRCVNSAKAVKDIIHNLNEFENSGTDAKHRQRYSVSEEWGAFEKKLSDLKQEKELTATVVKTDVLVAAEKEYEETRKTEVISLLKSNLIREKDASTILNVNRELYSAKKNLLLAVKEFHPETGLHKKDRIEEL